MTNDQPQESAQARLNSMLEWLVLAQGRTGVDEANGLQQQVRALGEMPLSTAMRLRFLDLFYEYAAKITLEQMPALHESALPVSHKIRQLVRATQDLLELLADAYLDTLAESVGQAPSPANALRRALQCLSWHLIIGYLAAAPLTTGIWQRLHSTYRIARRLGLDKAVGAGQDTPLDHAYLSNLLFSVVQPASFTARELEFIGQYIDGRAQDLEIRDTLPSGHGGIFWIDPDRDAPPHALTRRTPPPDTKVFYFACDRIAANAADHLATLEGGRSAAELELPAFADTHPGRGVLKRLSLFWGQPGKRKFPRRRQSYRADLCVGLEQLCQLLQSATAPVATTEWMITNESPDGYAMMHMSGTIAQLQVGDIAGLRRRREGSGSSEPWQICVVRWALSENPEHVELGLQALPGSGGVTARLAWPQGKTPYTPALFLPPAPPLRPSAALVAPTGAIDDLSQKLYLLVEQENFVVYELRATYLEQQTSSIEIFNVEPDERP